MNSDRLNELTKLLEQIAGMKSSDTTFAMLRAADARDILDLLNETTSEGAEVKGQQYHYKPGDVVEYMGRRFIVGKTPIGYAGYASHLVGHTENGNYIKWHALKLAARSEDLAAARDLLNAEPEDALPWKVHHHFDLVATFDDRERAETYLKGEQFAGRYTITGPDPPLPDVHGGQRAPYEAEADPDGSPDWPPARLADTPTPRLAEVYRLAQAWHDAIAKWNDAMDSRNPEAIDAAEPDMAKTQAELFAAMEADITICEDKND